MTKITLDHSRISVLLWEVTGWNSKQILFITLYSLCFLVLAYPSCHIGGIQRSPHVFISVPGPQGMADLSPTSFALTKLFFKLKAVLV